MCILLSQPRSWLLVILLASVFGQVSNAPTLKLVYILPKMYKKNTHPGLLVDCQTGPEKGFFHLITCLLQTKIHPLSSVLSFSHCKPNECTLHSSCCLPRALCSCVVSYLMSHNKHYFNKNKDENTY